MTVVFSDYVRDSSMWRKVRSVPIELDDPDFVLSALGFVHTSYGGYWLRTSYNEAQGVVLFDD